MDNYIKWWMVLCAAVVMYITACTMQEIFPEPHTKINITRLWVEGIEYHEWHTPGGATCIKEMPDGVTYCSY